MSNVYSHPEKHDLTIVAELELGEQYSFDTHLVFKHKDGRLFYAHDSGCSCPIPFDDYEGIQDMEEITIDSYERFYEQMWTIHAPLVDIIRFLEKVKSARDCQR